MKLAAIIMASGFSKRMGANKLLCELGGMPIYQYVFNAVQSCGFSEIVVVTRFQEIISHAQALGLTAAWNSEAEIGQSRSIYYGMLAVGACDGYAFFPADQPLLHSAIIRPTMQRFIQTPERIVVSRYAGQPGAPAFFPGDLRASLMTLQGDEHGKTVMRQQMHRVQYIDYEQAYPSMDADTPEDLERIRNIWENNLKCL